MSKHTIKKRTGKCKKIPQIVEILLLLLLFWLLLLLLVFSDKLKILVTTFYLYCIFFNHRLIMKCFISSYWKKIICDFKQSCSLSGGATISDLDYLSGFCARCRSLPPPYCQQLFTRFKLGSRTQLVSFPPFVFSDFWVFKRPTVFKSCVNAFVAAAFHREELSCLLRLQLKRSAEEMSSWGLEILKTTGPVFVMIDQCFDNGAKGGFDNFPGLLLKPQHDYAGFLGSPWSLFFTNTEGCRLGQSEV